MRRLILLVVLGAVCGGAGSALLAPPALAGGVDTDTGYLKAAVYNLTPYTMTLVKTYAPVDPQEPLSCGRAPSSCMERSPDATIAPGGGSLWEIGSYFQTGGSCPTFDYKAYFTYRIDVLDGPPEYQTVAIGGEADPGGFFCFGFSQDAKIWAFNTNAPPPSNYDPTASPNTPPGLNSKVQVTYVHNVPTLYDQTFESTVGNYTVDASTNLGHAFVDTLNALCSGAAGTSCSFTQTGPLTWGIGDPGSPYQASNCRATAGGQADRSSATAGDEPNNFRIEYKASQSATLTVGGKVTASAESELFDVVGVEVSVSIEAEHEWEEIKSVTRESKVFIPPGDIASLWVVPTVGKVTGTLVFSNGLATFTATNFSETRSGVSRNDLTPAYNVITKVRPMTAAEVNLHCPGSSTTTLRRASLDRPPAKLKPGQGVAGVALGQAQARGASPSLGHAGSVAAGPAPSGSTEVIDAKTNPEEAAQAFNTWCAHSSDCSWHNDTLTAGYGPPRILGDVLYNCSTDEQDTAETAAGITDERAETTTVSQGVSLKVSLGLIGVASTSAEFEAFVKEAQKFSTEVGVINTVFVPPGYKGYTTTQVLSANLTGRLYIPVNTHLIELTNIGMSFPGYQDAHDRSQSKVFYNGISVPMTADDFKTRCDAVSDTLGAPGPLPPPPPPQSFRLTLCQRPVTFTATVRQPSVDAACTTRKVTGRRPPAIGQATASLTAGGRTYADGTDAAGRIQLTVRRAIKRGNYTLTLRRGGRRSARSVSYSTTIIPITIH